MVRSDGGATSLPMESKRRKKLQQHSEGNDTVSSAPPWQAFLVHPISGLGLASALWMARNFYSLNLISDPFRTLRLVWIIMAPIVILLHSIVRQSPEKCSYWKAVGRGVLGLPAGAVVNALGAIALGAPVGIKYLMRTLNWSMLMSLFTVVPAASVFGSSWTDWQRILAHTKPMSSIDYMICLPAHGAVIGAWFGAWPMPLDWERPWQEWPICVSYGAIAGYSIAMVASFVLLLLCGDQQHVKGE
ncbi:PIGF/3-ketodihydrosphingosine reductase fusion protein [Diospyros lotus]|uniref:PIGF/3-ketodihydrosphingosine reductase fusion protein n=1 Tax=Diospyros lotus TaxID=55363 RepID=UPI00225B9351|nr:PIGF/3-ketodihydrosphingosine reductase fusion protein [Diospyros lotus]